jgi:regulator of protease activity HflC (stomatin/prohibitin superfamily)
MFTVATLGFMIALLVVVLVFSRLLVTVNAGRVVAAFLFGRPRREIKLEDVTAVREVRNRWIQGWGIRKISGGWMYNVWGLDAVEVEISSDKVFRIGTNDPENLLATISLQIKR